MMPNNMDASATKAIVSYRKLLQLLLFSSIPSGFAATPTAINRYAEKVYETDATKKSKSFYNFIGKLGPDEASETATEVMSQAATEASRSQRGLESLSSRRSVPDSEAITPRGNVVDDDNEGSPPMSFPADSIPPDHMSELLQYIPEKIQSIEVTTAEINTYYNKGPPPGSKQGVRNKSYYQVWKYIKTEGLPDLPSNADEPIIDAYIEYLVTLKGTLERLYDERSYTEAEFKALKEARQEYIDSRSKYGFSVLPPSLPPSETSSVVGDGARRRRGSTRGKGVEKTVTFEKTGMKEITVDGDHAKKLALILAEIDAGNKSSVNKMKALSIIEDLVKLKRLTKSEAKELIKFINDPSWYR
jgi:hypothetical protein